jgi:hypothetical protein
LRANAPVHFGFAFAGDLHGRGLAGEDGETFQIERDANGLRGGEIVVNVGGDGNFIALAEEARHGEAAQPRGGLPRVQDANSASALIEQELGK